MSEQTAVSRRPHQVRALVNLQAAYARTDRAQLHWACGTGKTLVGRWLAEDTAADATLVVVPSLALIAQTLAEWQDAVGEWRFDPLVVCSDPSTTDTWRVDADWWSEHGVQVTTDERQVAQFLAEPRSRPRVVFSTYHSVSVVAAAAKRVRTVFDLLVCDEAHRAADPDGRFGIVVDEQRLPARRRMFATATPLASMSDAAVFGPVADRLDIADAIAAGLLVDYQVLVLDVAGDTDRLDRAQTVPAVLAAAAREGMSRVISFHSRIHAARRFAADINGLQLPDGRTVRAEAVAGTDPAAHRRKALARLASGGDALTLVSNARCLTEGVNVPAVDGVVFADPKSSDTDIVQAIGRALRPAPGKTRGLIILPVVVPPGADDETLAAGEFASVWGVLRTLRSMDPRMAAELDQPPRPGPPGRERHGGTLPLLRFELPEGIDVGRFVARIADPTGSEQAWSSMYDQLVSWVTDHGHAAVPTASNPLSHWVSSQRRTYAAAALAPDRVQLLSSLPGWSWTRDGSWWNADHDFVLATAASGHGLNPNDEGTAGTRMPHRVGGKSGLTIGLWCARQRITYRTLELGDNHATRCEEIPGWTWDAGIPVRDQRMIDALAEWVDVHGDANVPEGETWGAAPLGAFVAAIRRRAITGRLLPALADEIVVVTPAKPHAGAFDWQPAETRWRLHLLALRQFVARTGGCDIPEHHTEALPDATINLYAWAVRQRHRYRHGHLDPARAAVLEQVPDWTWERARKDRVTVGVAGREHGTRAAYAAGCRCEPCTESNRSYEAERIRRKAAGLPGTDLVDAAPVRTHLRTLEGRLAYTRRARTCMQRITGLNKKTVDELINGERKRIHPEVADALTALTTDQLLSFIEENPSPTDPKPAAVFLALVDDLVERGWPKAWIGREIGQDGRALQITKGQWLHRRTAEAITELHHRVGRRPPPSREWHSKLPTLDEILALEESAFRREAVSAA